MSNDLNPISERSDHKTRLRNTVERFNKVTYKKEPTDLAEWYNRMCYDRDEVNARKIEK